MIDPKRGDRARYFGSRGAPMDGTLTDIVEQDGRLLLKMKLDAYEGHVEGWSECFRRIKRKGPLKFWLNADQLEAMVEAGEPAKLNASPYETRMGQRWIACVAPKETKKDG